MKLINLLFQNIIGKKIIPIFFSVQRNLYFSAIEDTGLSTRSEASPAETTGSTWAEGTTNWTQKSSHGTP